MSWPDVIGRLASRRLTAALMAVALAAGTGCGFRPLYGPTEAQETGSEAGFAQTQISPLSGRTGQKLHNLLRDRLNPAGQAADYRYSLDVSVTTAVSELGIRKDETATRANLIVRADYVLRSRETRALLFNARSESANSYNIVDDFYATSVSQESALDRGLREVANEIRRRLGIYFSRGPSTAQP